LTLGSGAGWNLAFGGDGEWGCAGGGLHYGLG
jgi:hypothetical protein